MSRESERALFDLVRKRLIEERKRRSLSQEDLAARSGVDRVAIGYIEQARRRPTLQTLLKLAEAMKIPLIDLLRRK